MNEMSDATPSAAGTAPRRTSLPVDVDGVIIGGASPIVVQSMTNTDTADAAATAEQVAALVEKE